MLNKNFTFKPSGLINNTKPDEKTQKANRYPIENLYTGSLKKSGHALMGKCPFHNESIPSFAIYPETNTWNCFAGCGGGDAIAFYMKLYQCDFKTALEALNELC